MTANTNVVHQMTHTSNDMASWADPDTPFRDEVIAGATNRRAEYTPWPVLLAMASGLDQLFLLKDACEQYDAYLSLTVQYFLSKGRFGEAHLATTLQQGFRDLFAW